MELNEVYTNLCVYDKRSSHYDMLYHDEDVIPRNDCYCDNCFYGRDELAMEILSLLEEILT